MDIMTAHQVACGEARAEAPVLEEILKTSDGYNVAWGGFAWVQSYVKR